MEKLWPIGWGRIMTRALDLTLAYYNQHNATSQQIKKTNKLTERSQTFPRHLQVVLIRKTDLTRELNSMIISV